MGGFSILGVRFDVDASVSEGSPSKTLAISLTAIISNLWVRSLSVELADFCRLLSDLCSVGFFRLLSGGGSVDFCRILLDGGSVDFRRLLSDGGSLAREFSYPSSAESSFKRAEMISSVVKFSSVS